MTAKQREIITRLQEVLRAKRRITEKLPITEHEGDVFTEVKGATVRIGRAGGIDLLAVRSYLDAFDAAVSADMLFAQQQERDVANPSRASAFRTGHFNPRVDAITMRCSGDRKCPRCR